MNVTTVITDRGFALLRAAPGYKLVYTRAVCGSGYVDKTRLAELTEIQAYEMDLSIVDVRPTSAAATVRLQLDCRRANHEFQLYQIGLYAKLLDDNGGAVFEDTLFQVMQYENPDIVRLVPHVSEFVINTIFGQARDVSGEIDMAAYVSIRQFRLEIEKLLRSIMTGEVTLPLLTVAGEELLTAAGTPILARYRLERSGAVMADAAKEIQQSAAGLRAYADSTKQAAISAAGADAAARVKAASDSLSAKITRDIAAHNGAEAAHPTHLMVVRK